MASSFAPLSFPRLRLRHDQFELRTAIELGKKIVLVHGESNKTRTSLRAVGDRSCDRRPPTRLFLRAFCVMQRPRARTASSTSRARRLRRLLTFAACSMVRALIDQSDLYATVHTD